MVATGRADTGYTGVQIRDSGSVRVQVPFGGRWVWESVPFGSSAAGLKQAARHRQAVIDRCRVGAIEWREWFPDSPRCQPEREAPPPPRVPTFAEQAETWFRHAGARLAASTQKGNRKRLDGIWKPALGDKLVTEIRHSHILDVLADKGWTSGKTQENALSVAKSVMESARLDGHITVNPVEGVKTLRAQKERPDPLAWPEIAAVLGWFAARESPWLPYFLVAFGTGMRPSELAALRWEDIDWIEGTVRVSRGVVNGVEGPTKTAVEREVKLLPMALDGLKRQKAVTFLSGSRIFVQPATGKPLNDEQPARKAWTAALKGAGVRHRKAYSTRHTFATRLIMTGTHFVQVSKSLGHAAPTMTLNAYTRWIEGEIAEQMTPEEAFPALGDVPNVFQKARRRA